MKNFLKGLFTWAAAVLLLVSPSLASVQSEAMLDEALVLALASELRMQSQIAEPGAGVYRAGAVETIETLVCEPTVVDVPARR